jgi:hypothetical protein
MSLLIQKLAAKHFVAVDSEIDIKIVSLPIQKSVAMMESFQLYFFFFFSVYRNHPTLC